MANEVAMYDGETGEIELSRAPEIAIDARTRAEVDTLVRTAKTYPRSFKRFQMFSEAMALRSKAIAESCTYAKPIGGGKFAIGPSVRLAEIMVPAWGNCSIEARVIEENDRFLIAQGTAVDYESNARYSVEIMRRITDRNGRKYSDDMVMNAGNAARSIAYRTVAFLMIPKTLVEEVRLKAVEVANGKRSLEEIVAKLLASFGSIGVEERRVYLGVGVEGRQDLTFDHVETLRALWTAIQDAETTPDAAFPKLDAIGAPTAPAPSRAEALADKIARPAEAKPTAKAP